MTPAPPTNKRQRSWHDDQTTEELLALIDALDDNGPDLAEASSSAPIIGLDPCAPHAPPQCGDSQSSDSQSSGLDLFSVYHHMLINPDRLLFSSYDPDAQLQSPDEDFDEDWNSDGWSFHS